MFNPTMKSPTRSIYTHFANQSINWLPMDTEELYLRNLSTNRELLEQNNWVDKSFTYTFNSHGFRCNEFTNDPTVMFLGCSYTCGIGLPINTIWPELVSKQLNMRCANLGQGGGSIDTAFRLCLGWIHRIKPKLVVFLRPPGVRWEVLGDNNGAHFLFGDEELKMDGSYTMKYISNEINNTLNYQKNLYAMQYICQRYDIKFLHFGVGWDSVGQKDFAGAWARDLAHPGSKSHQLFADRVLNSI